MKPSAKQQILPTVLVGLVLCVAAMFWPASRDERPFTVAVTVWPGMEALLMGGQAARSNATRINFVEMSWPTAVAGAFRKRVVDAAVVSLDELLRLEADGARPRAVLILGVSKGSDAVLARPLLKGVPDLRGKRVGVELRSGGEYLLMRALRKNRMMLSDVERVPLNLAETESAFVADNLDAVVTSDPWCTRLKDKGAAVLFDSSQAGLELTRVLVVREEAIEAHAEAIRLLVEAHLRLVTDFREAGDSSGLDAILRREGLTPAQWGRTLSLIHFPTAEENQRLMDPETGELVKCLRKMAAEMAEAGLLTGDVRTEVLLNAGFVKGGGR